LPYLGGLLLCAPAVHVAGTVSSSRFTHNDATVAGGGIYVDGSATLALANTTFAGNTAGHGAGFAVWSNATTNLQNVTFKDNSAGAWGAGMSVGGTTRADVWNATFHNNTSGQGCGALYAYEKSSTNVTHAVFTKNSATGTYGGGAMGVWDDATMTIVDANMTANTATFGGAIDMRENGTLRLHSSSLSGNTAAQSGGALYLKGTCSAVVTMCTFANNTAREQDGGAVLLIQLANATITASRLINNRARSGGGVFCSNSSVRVVASNLSGNRATLRGGALAGEGNATITVDNCALDANQGPRGGAVAVIDAFLVRLDRCAFKGNVAGEYGGGVFVGGKTRVTMLSGRLINNSGNLEGGALVVTGSSRVVLSGAIAGRRNTASKGGFASLDGTSQLEVSNGTFEGNYASANGRGGLLYLLDKAMAKLTGCYVTGSMYQPDVYGGAFNMDGNATLTLSLCTVDGMHAQRGGAFAVFGNASVNASNFTISNCTAVNEGGGIYSASVNRQAWRGGILRDMHARTGAAMCIMGGDVHIAGTTFVDATSSDGGGALNVDLATHVALDQCTIQDCTAVDGSGGALLLQGDARVSLVDCNISDCRTQMYAGGAIAGHGNVSVVLQHCRLLGNRATTCGGAAYVQNTARLVATSSNITDNVCSDRGGGVCASGDASFSLQGCTVSQNSADVGGAFSLSGQASMDLTLTVVENNSAIFLWWRCGVVEQQFLSCTGTCFCT
jgi:predicted outer membrane repeat protein